MLSQDQFAAVDRLFNEALDQPPETRARWLEAACPDDQELRDRVAMLLELIQPDDDELNVEAGIAGPLWDELAEDLGSSRQDDSAFQIGDQLGNYRITGFLGRGGMGHVYRAEDSNLEREVALKALSPGFTNDPGNLRRFQREAKLLASLNHPNIAGIYDLIESEDQPFLVLEYVDGETLDRRLTRSKLPLPEVLTVGRQLAEALEEAHRKGVIHRDLKPSNIKLARSGRTKVLDFGLAKSRPLLERSQRGVSGKADNDPENPTLAGEKTTHAGMVLGTPGYMSPEQARSEEVDKRTDIWAFGCLIYEMLTGNRAFTGESPSEALAAVLRDPVDWGPLPADTPLPLRRLIRRCLEKNPDQRLQDIGDARIELEEILAATTSGIDSYPDWQPVPTSVMAGAREYLKAFVFLAAGLACGFWLASSISPRKPNEGVTRSLIRIGPQTRRFDGASPTIAISPDASHLAWIGSRDGNVSLFVRPIDAFEPVEIRRSDNARNPFFSSDGDWIGFFAEGELRKASVTGERVETLATNIGLQLRGASWTEAGILFAQDSGPGIYRVPSNGGTPELISKSLNETRGNEHIWPQWLDGGRHAVITVRDTSESQVSEQLAILNIDDGRIEPLRAGSQASAMPGHLVFVRNGSLEAMPFDMQKRHALGPASPVLDEIHGYPGGSTTYAVSSSGTLVYLPPQASISLAWLDRYARLSRLEAPEGTPGWPRLSSDATQAAIHIGTPERRNVFVLDVARPGSARQLTLEGGGFPVWSPDGKRIAFMSRRDGRGNLYTSAADGSDTAVQIVGGTRTKIPTSWGPNGRLAYYEIAESTQRDIWTVDVDSGESEPFVNTEANELAAAFSPNGRWLAYVSNQSGQNEIYVRGFPPPGPVLAVSIEGGTEPVWSADGAALYYRRGETLMFVELRESESLSATAPRPLLDTELIPNASGNATYDVMPTGEQFLVLRRAGPAEDRLRLVQNWVDELDDLHPESH